MTLDPKDPHNFDNEDKVPNRKKESLEEMLGFQDFFSQEPENDPFAGKDPFAESVEPLPPSIPEHEIMAEDLLDVKPQKRLEDSFPWELPEFDSQVHAPDDEEDDLVSAPHPSGASFEMSTEVSTVSASSDISEMSTEVSTVSASSDISEMSTEVSAVSKLPLENETVQENAQKHASLNSVSEEIDPVPTGVELQPSAAKALDESTPVAQLPVDTLFSQSTLSETNHNAASSSESEPSFQMEIEDIPDFDLDVKSASSIEIEDIPELNFDAPASQKLFTNKKGDENDVVEIDEEIVELVEEENLWITPPGSLLTNESPTSASLPPPLPAPPPLPTPVTVSQRVEIEDPTHAYPEPDPARLTAYGSSLLAKTPEEKKDRWLFYAEKATTDAEKARFLHESGYLAESVGDTATAIKLFARAMDVDPSLAPNLWHIRRFLFLKGMLDKVEPLLKLEMEKSDPRERTFLHYWSGFIAECLGLSVQAETAYEAALQENSGHLPSLFALWRQSMLANDVRRQLDVLARMEPLWTSQKLQIAFTIYSAHLLERVGDVQEAIARYDAVAVGAGEWSIMVWQVLERLLADDPTALANMLEKEAIWMDTAGMTATATALHLEASLLWERDAANPEEAFSRLEMRALEHPLVRARLFDLAWRCGHREYLDARHQDMRTFATLWAHAVSGGTVNYNPSTDTLDVLWLSDATQPDPHLHKQFDNTQTAVAALAPLQLLCTYRSNDPEVLEACLNTGAAPKEAWWTAYWLSLEKSHDATRACLKRMRQQALDVYDDFFRREEIFASLLHTESYAHALTILDADARDTGEHLLAAEIALLCNDTEKAIRHFQEVAQTTYDPKVREIAILHAAKRILQSGNLAQARKLCAEYTESLLPDVEESANWLARLDHDVDFFVTRLEQFAHDTDRMEVAILLARSNPGEAMRLLETIQSPQARWMYLESAIQNGDFEIIRDLTFQVANDYPEDADVLLAALGIYIRDHAKMDVLEFLQQALTMGTVDRTLVLAVEREFAAAGRPRDIWRETQTDLPEEDELEKLVALAWDEQDPQAADQLEAFSLRTAGTSQRIAAIFARFVALRNRDKQSFVRLLEQAGPSRRLDFRRFWNSDPQNPEEDIYSCAIDPFNHTVEELRAFYGNCFNAPDVANWEALACEKRGQLSEALARRRFTGFEIPSYLALSRIARASTDVLLLSDAEIRLAKHLPEGHPRRLVALDRTAAAASLAERPHLALQASWLAYQDTPSEDALRRCIDYAIATENHDCLRFFLIQAQYIIRDDERKQIAQDYLHEEGSDWLDTDPASVGAPPILALENIWPQDAYTPPSVDNLTAHISPENWIEDASLLLELAATTSDSHLYEEAATLFVLADEIAAAQGILSDLEESTVRALLQTIIAFRQRDAAEAISALQYLQSQVTDPLHIALCELLLDEDTDLPEELDHLPEVFETSVDLCIQRGDESGLLKRLDTTQNPLWLYVLARSISDREPAKATEAYLKLLQGDLAIPALFQILRLAWRTEKSVFIKPALMRLSQLCTDPFVTLEKIRSGMDVSEIPSHPLVIFVAYLQGIVDALTVAQHVRSTSLRLRLLTQAALRGNIESAIALTELEPGGMEPELVRRMAAWEADQNAVVASWSKVSGLTDVLRWWMDLAPEENATVCTARILDDLRARTSWDDNWRLLPQEMQEPLESLARLRFGYIPEGDFRIPSVDRMVAFALHTENRQVLLEEEYQLQSQNEAVLFGLVLFDENRLPEASCPWILASYRREKSGIPVASAWEPSWQTPNIDWSLLAWRAAICEELQADTPSTSWQMHVAPPVVERISRRWERRMGIPASLPFADAVDEVSLGMNYLHSVLLGTETIEYLEGETEPVLQELARRAMFRMGLWPDLARMYLQQLENNPDPLQKAECFRQLIRIDSEGRKDMDSAILMRRALAETYPQDLCNLLWLLETDRENANPESELVWFSAFMQQVGDAPEKTAFHLETWRLEYMLNRTLPDRENVQALLASNSSDAALSWWAFCLLPSFPFQLATRLYDVTQESGMIFARRYAEQCSWDEAQPLWDALLAHWSAEIPLLDQCLKSAFSVGAGARCAQLLTLLSKDLLLSEEDKIECLYMAGLSEETWAENATGAVERYQHVLQKRPDHEDAFLRCRQLLLQLNRPEELAQLLQSRTHVETRPGVLARLLVDLAELQLLVLQDRPAARLTYMRLVEQVPEWKPGLSQLADLHEEASDFENAISIMKQWLSIETDPVVRCTVCRRLGLAERQLGHTHAALDWYIQSLELDPNQLDLWEYVVDLHQELADPRKAAWALKKCITLQPKMHAKVNYLHRLSDIYENQLHDKKLARDALLEAVEVSDADMDAVESLVHFYDRQADSVSRNVKLDLLWTAERQKIVSLTSVEPILRIAHFAMWKQNPQMAQLLSECAVALGVASQKLPAEPQTAPMDIETLAIEDVASFLFPSDLLQGQRRIIQVVHNEACRQLRDVFKKSLPARSERVRQIPSSLLSALGTQFKSIEIYRHSRLQWLPMDPPVLLVPASWNLEEIHESQWQFLLGGHLFLHRIGLSIPLALNAEQMVHFLAALVQNVFPDRHFDNMDAQLVQEYSKYASKIVGRKDRDLLAGTILEMGSFDHKELSGIQDALLRSADRAGYVCAGGFAPVMQSLDLLENGNARALKLLQFVASQLHVQLREAALVARMRV